MASGCGLSGAVKSGYVRVLGLAMCPSICSVNFKIHGDLKRRVHATVTEQSMAKGGAGLPHEGLGHQ